MPPSWSPPLISHQPAGSCLQPPCSWIGSPLKRSGSARDGFHPDSRETLGLPSEPKVPSPSSGASENSERGQFEPLALSFGETPGWRALLGTFGSTAGGQKPETGGARACRPIKTEGCSMDQSKDVQQRIDRLVERAQSEVLSASRRLAAGITKETERLVPPVLARYRTGCRRGVRFRRASDEGPAKDGQRHGEGHQRAITSHVSDGSDRRRPGRQEGITQEGGSGQQGSRQEAERCQGVGPACARALGGVGRLAPDWAGAHRGDVDFRAARLVLRYVTGVRDCSLNSPASVYVELPNGVSVRTRILRRFSSGRPFAASNQTSSRSVPTCAPLRTHC